MQLIPLSPQEVGQNAAYLQEILIISASSAELPDNTDKGGRDALRAADVVFLFGRIPIELKRPSLRAMWQQAAQREPNFDPVHSHVGATRYAGAEDVD